MHFGCVTGGSLTRFKTVAGSYKLANNLTALQRKSAIKKIKGANPLKKVTQGTADPERHAFAQALKRRRRQDAQDDAKCAKREARAAARGDIKGKGRATDDADEDEDLEDDIVDLRVSLHPDDPLASDSDDDEEDQLVPSERADSSEI